MSKFRIHSSKQPALPIHVLVVDDSAVVRQVMTEVLTADGGFRVVTAPDPIVAEMKIRLDHPDVVVLDLEMPRMDGLTFLRKLMKENPLPVVICSGWAQCGTDTALKALEEGAVEIVAKPCIGVKEFLQESAVLLSDAIRAAAAARSTTQMMHRKPPVPEPIPHRVFKGNGGIIAAAASTGGTEALVDFLRPMQADSPGIVIVQHMPARFTAGFARRLNELCRISVREARDGDQVEAGTALIAPGDRHIELAGSRKRYLVHVSDGPLVSRHRPSADVLFRSVARVAGPDAVGVIMTGMGSDGAEGMLEMRRAGAYTIAQDEATSVVYGMPKEALALGGVCAVAPLDSLSGLALTQFEK